MTTRFFGQTAVLLFALAGLSTRGADEPGSLSVLAAGAKADGASDDTAAIQRALDEAAKTGGRVLLPSGRYLV